MDVHRSFRIGWFAFAAFAAVILTPIIASAQPSGGLSPAGSPPGIRPPAAGSPAAPRAPLPEGPQIKEFHAPEQIVLGEPVTLGWQVDPGFSGSPVAHVSILLGESIVEGSVPPRGRREVRLLSYPVGATSVVYTLKARDAAGKISTRNATVRLMGPQQALNQLEISLQSEPREFRPGQAINFKVGIRSGIWPMRRLKILLLHEHRGVASLMDFMVRAPMEFANLRDDGFTGSPGDYYVTIEYMGLRITKQFRTYGIPLYSLTPVTR